MTVRPTVKGVRHVGLYGKDPERLAAFYREVLGLDMVGLGQVNVDGLRVSAFLGSRSTEGAYQVAIFTNPEIRHTAFRVETLADLRAFYQVVIDRELPIRWALNHGVSLAFYFHDPAGNLIKLYCPTGVAYPQPHGHPIDLTQSDATLRQDVAALVAQLKVSKGG